MVLEPPFDRLNPIMFSILGAIMFTDNITIGPSVAVLIRAALSPGPIERAVGVKMNWRTGFQVATAAVKHIAFDGSNIG